MGSDGAPVPVSTHCIGVERGERSGGGDTFVVALSRVSDLMSASRETTVVTNDLSTVFGLLKYRSSFYTSAFFI